MTHSLNHIFRLVWSQAQQCWVAVAETARSRGKTGRTRRRLVAATVLAILPLVQAQAGPGGGQITAGSGSISSTGLVTTVRQNSATLSLGWQSFNVGPGETVNFIQPSSTAIAVNRVLGADGSQILGRIHGNGQVWLINPNGILFGRDAQVNVGGLVPGSQHA
jgi:filamentous hemagglutinin family protein